MTERETIVLYETIPQALCRDAIAFATLAGTIGLGVLLDSEAMQWVGAILAMLVLLGKSVNLTKSAYKKPQEAADYLKEEFGVTAKARSE